MFADEAVSGELELATLPQADRVDNALDSISLRSSVDSVVAVAITVSGSKVNVTS